MRDICMARGKDEVLTRIIVEAYDKRYIVESPYSDSNILGNLLDMVYVISRMATYSEDTILRAMEDFLEEHGFKEEEETSLQA